MATSIRTRTARIALVALLLSVAGIAQAGTSTATMGVGLTLRAPGEANVAPRSDGVVNPAGTMATDALQQRATRAAVDAAPRSERWLATSTPDGSRVLSVQF